MFIKISRFSIDLILVLILVWSIANLTGYLLINQFIRNGYFENILVAKLSLKEDLHYKLNGSAKLHWNPFSLGIDVANFNFSNISDENQKLNIDITSVKLKFSIIRLMTGDLLPSEIYLKDNKIFLDNSAFKNNPIDDYKHEIRYKSVLEVIKKIKKIYVRNMQFDFITWGGEKLSLAVDTLDAEKYRDFINIDAHYHNNFFKDIGINGSIKIPDDHNDRKIEVIFFQSKVTSHEYKFLHFSRIKSANLIFSGKGFVDMNPDLTVKESEINFTNVSGSFDRDLFDEHGNKSEVKKQILKDSAFLFKWNYKSKLFSIKKFLFFLENATLSGDLNADLFKPVKTLTVDFESKNLKMDQLYSFWPDDLAVYTRAWYEKAVRAGTSNSTGKLVFLFDNDRFLHNESTVDINTEIKNVELSCCKGHIPTLYGIYGTFKIDMHGLSGKVDGAYFKTLNNSKVHLNKGFDRRFFSKISNDLNKLFIDVNDEQNYLHYRNTAIIDEKIRIHNSLILVNFDTKKVAIDAKASGKLKALMDFYKKDYKIDVLGDDVLKDINGDASANAKLNIDLNDQQDRILKKIEIISKNLSSKLENNEVDVTSDDFILTIDDEKATFFLDGLANTKKFNVKGDVDLFTNKFEYTVRLYDNHYSDFSKVFDKIIGDVVEITGNISGEIKITKDDFKSTYYNVILDLANTKLFAPYIRLNKDLGDYASLVSHVEQRGENFYIKNLNFYNQDHKLKIDYLFYDSANKKLLIQNLNYNNETHVDEVNISDDGRMKAVKIEATDVFYKNFNWLGFSRRKDEKTQLEQKIIINGKTKNLVFKNESKFLDVEFNLFCDSRECQEILIHNSSDNKKNQFNASLINDKILIVSSDAGALLNGLDVTEYIHGGKLYLEGHLVKYPNGMNLIQSTSQLTDFTVKNAPVIAQIFSITAFDSLVSVLKGDGVTFDNMTVNFIFIDDKVFFSRSVADGKSIGISFEGELDLIEKKMNLRGSFAPLNIINIAMRQIPFFGNMLVGHKGDGLFTIDFKLDGDISKPKASVNAVTIFAPYAIKRFFNKERD
jgi:hypothetical protein